MKTTLSTKGQLILPKAIRQRLGWTPGTEVDVTERGGRVILQVSAKLPAKTLAEIIGSAHYRGPRRSVAQMDAAIKRGAKR